MRYSRFLFLIGFALFGFLLWFLGPEKVSGIFATLSKADLLIFAAAIFLILPAVIIKGIKQSVLLKPFGKKISLKESTQVWLAGYLLGAISPGRSGDFLRVVYFKKNFGIKSGNGISAVLLERILDVGFLLVAGIIGFIYFSVMFGLPQIIIFVLAGVLAVLFFLLTQKKIMTFLARPFYRRLVPKRLKKRASAAFHDFYEGLSAFSRHKKNILFALLLTVFSWLLFFVQAFLLALALKLPLSLAAVSAVMPAAALAEIVPTIFGIGTRDATMIFFSSFLQISSEAAVSFSLTILVIEIVQAFFGALFLRKIKNA